MISGAHIVLYTKDPEADRAFFREVLELGSVDAGHGWLIFALPPAEAAFSEIQEARWGSIVKMRLPGGGGIGLYQPKHPTALSKR